MVCKYIIVDTGAILFNECTVHSDVAVGFKKVYSAGFVTIAQDGILIKCYGESISLDIKSQPAKDEQIIRDLFVRVSVIKYFGFNVKEFYESV